MSIETYIAEQFHYAVAKSDDVRDFCVEIDDETYTVSFMTDDEPETTWEFVCGSDDDEYRFVNLDDHTDVISFPLMPE
jgi:hypothetical protein